MPIRRWTTTKIINEILSFPINKRYSTYIKKHREDLWKAAWRHFGSWNMAIKACGLDYSQIIKNGPRIAPNVDSGGICIYLNCEKKHHAYGLCQIHYNKERRKEIKSTLLCYKCNKYKRYSAFYKNISTFSGCSFPCKECKTKYDKNYRVNKKDYKMEHKDFKPIRMGNKIDSSKLTTLITRDIYKDEKGFFYRNKSSIKCVNIFKCKLCKIKTANAQQKDTCTGCTQTYRAGFRRDQGVPFVFTPNNITIVSKFGEDGNKIYRSVGLKWRNALYKYGCNKCNTESLYQRDVTPKRCHYCWYLQQKRSPMAGIHTKGNVAWTKDKILSALNKLEPSQRNWTYLEKNGGMPLYHAAKRCFSSWEDALLALNQEETDPQLASFLLLTEGNWKKANLLYNISTKIPLSRRIYRHMMKDGNMRFYQRAAIYFGNWQNTLSLLKKNARTATMNRIQGTKLLRHVNQDWGSDVMTTGLKYKITKLHKEIVKLVHLMSVYKDKDNSWLCIGMKLLELTDAIGGSKEDWREHFNVSSFTNYCSEILKDSRDTMTKYRINAKCIKDYRNDLYEKWEEDNSTQIPKYTVLYELLGKKKVLSDDKFKEILDFIINDDPSIFKVREAISVPKKEIKLPDCAVVPFTRPVTNMDWLNDDDDDLDIDTHISERDARHEPYCNMLKEVAQRIGREAQGSILSLCGISPLIDKTRIQTWFYGSDTYIWYEIKQNVYNKIKNKAKSLNKIFGGFVNHEIHFGDILESRHDNVALLNLDLEGPGSIMTEKLMNQVESMVLSALTKRKRTGLILNTHTRGPKGMTCCKRIALWYTMLSNVESKGYRVVKPIEPVSYCNTAGSQMQLYAVAFEKTK